MLVPNETAPFELLRCFDDPGVATIGELSDLAHGALDEAERLLLPIREHTGNEVDVRLKVGKFGNGACV